GRAPAARCVPAAGSSRMSGARHLRVVGPSPDGCHSVSRAPETFDGADRPDRSGRPLPPRCARSLVAPGLHSGPAPKPREKAMQIHYTLASVSLFAALAGCLASAEEVSSEHLDDDPPATT